MTRKSMIRATISAVALAAVAGLALAGAQAGGSGARLEPASYAPGDARYLPASQLQASDLLNATVFTDRERGAGRVFKIDFDSSGAPEWVWLRFDGAWGDWSLRAPVSSLYLDRAAGKVRTDRTLEELRRLAEVDPEISARTATAIPARFAPASRLMGLRIVGNHDDRVGYVHSVRADASGAADTLVVERRFGLFHAKTERYDVPAEQVSYLPVTQQLVIHDLPQPTLASLADLAGG